MKPTKENEIRESVRAALQKLATGAVCTRTDLFGPLEDRSSDFNRTTIILKRLRDGNLINSTGGEKPGEIKIHSAVDRDALTKIANDDFELSRLIWPGRTPPKPITQRADIAGALAEPEPEPVPEANESILTMPSNEKMLDEILRLVVALTLNVIHIREKIDKES